MGVDLPRMVTEHPSIVACEEAMVDTIFLYVYNVRNIVEACFADRAFTATMISCLCEMTW